METDASVDFSELLRAFESARTRLAVAIAAEAKSTPVQQWQYYLDTSYKICRFVRRLRRLNHGESRQHPSLIRMLKSLESLPVQGDPRQLCKILLELVEKVGEAKV